jgi:hypothetical protein
MMTGMMETFKNDTLSVLYGSIMMTNPQMKDQIYKNRNANGYEAHEKERFEL